MKNEIQIAQAIHCNRCGLSFSAPKSLNCQPFCGERAARIDEFCTCPHCQQTDCHWLHAADVMPRFEGNFDGRKRAEREWLQAN